MGDCYYRLTVTLQPVDGRTLTPLGDAVRRDRRVSHADPENKGFENSVGFTANKLVREMVLDVLSRDGVPMDAPATADRR